MVMRLEAVEGWQWRALSAFAALTLLAIACGLTVVTDRTPTR